MLQVVVLHGGNQAEKQLCSLIWESETDIFELLRAEAIEVYRCPQVIENNLCWPLCILETPRAWILYVWFVFGKNIPPQGPIKHVMDKLVEEDRAGFRVHAPDSTPGSLLIYPRVTKLATMHAIFSWSTSLCH